MAVSKLDTVSGRVRRQFSTFCFPDKARMVYAISNCVQSASATGPNASKQAVNGEEIRFIYNPVSLEMTFRALKCSAADCCVSVLWTVARIDTLERRSLRVVLNHRRGGFPEDTDSLSDRLGPVIFSNEERAVASVANPFSLRWFVLAVINLAALGATNATSEPLHDHFLRNFKTDNLVQPLLKLEKHFIQRFRLLYRSWKTVQNKARLLDLRIVKLLRHHLDRNAVRHELAVIDVPLGHASEIRLHLDLVAEDFAGREGS